MGRIESICISAAKGERKHLVQAAVLRAHHGIEGDAHTGSWHRQVSLLAAEDIDAVRRRSLPELAPGAFAENMAVSGLELRALGLGSRLRLGRDAVLAITQIGKRCHAPCVIQRETGDCIMPRLGLFARVLAGGAVAVGDRVDVEERIPRERVQAVVLTLSDRCSRGEARDTAGPAVAARLQAALGAHLYEATILPDERALIAERLKHYADGPAPDLVVTVGGTGFAPRDTTPEATRDVVERLTPGLDEAMRAVSLAHTPHAMLSRGISGIRGSTLIINLPGSERGALENLEAILPALGHGLAKLSGDPSDCGRGPSAAAAQHG